MQTTSGSNRHSVVASPQMGQPRCTNIHLDNAETLAGLSSVHCRTLYAVPDETPVH
jgi:hypothetical protein